MNDIFCLHDIYTFETAVRLGGTRVRLRWYDLLIKPHPISDENLLQFSKLSEHCCVMLTPLTRWSRPIRFSATLTRHWCSPAVDRLVIFSHLRNFFACKSGGFSSPADQIWNEIWIRLSLWYSPSRVRYVYTILGDANHIQCRNKKSKITTKLSPTTKESHISVLHLNTFEMMPF